MWCSMFSSCKHDDALSHYTITFYNNSDKEVYISPSLDYPDTVNVPNYHVLGLPDIYKVAPHGYNKTALEVRDSYEKTLRIHENGKMDTLMVFVFDANILEANRRYDYKALLQRIDVNIEDLRKLNWVLSYPHK